MAPVEILFIFTHGQGGRILLFSQVKASADKCLIGLLQALKLFQLVQNGLDEFHVFTSTLPAVLTEQFDKLVIIGLSLHFLHQLRLVEL